MRAGAQAAVDKRFSGWLPLRDVRSGKVRVTLQFEALPCAVTEGAGKPTALLNWEEGVAGPVRVSRRTPGAVGIVQVMVLRAAGLRYEKERKKDVEPNAFVRLQLGEHRAETRVVRASHNPVFNEYFEFAVRDLNRQRIDVTIKVPPCTRRAR